tara:strand:+ start:48 stop:518 length:471 start_codon:yes stop_codon:yes gene_type:complete
MFYAWLEEFRTVRYYQNLEQLGKDITNTDITDWGNNPTFLFGVKDSGPVYYTGANRPVNLVRVWLETECVASFSDSYLVFKWFGNTNGFYQKEIIHQNKFLTGISVSFCPNSWQYYTNIFYSAVFSNFERNIQKPFMTFAELQSEQTSINWQGEGF